MYLKSYNIAGAAGAQKLKLILKVPCQYQLLDGFKCIGDMKHRSPVIDFNRRGSERVNFNNCAAMLRTPIRYYTMDSLASADTRFLRGFKV